MSHSKTLSGLIIMMCVLCFSSSCNKDNSIKNSNQLAQWRGDNRDGIYHETELLDEWPESGPEKLWIYEGIGKGFAAPSILNDRIFVNGEIDSTSYLFAFAMDGKLLWKSPNGPEFMGEGFSATYPGSRSAPTVVNNLVYTTSGSGRIACFEASTGEEQWAVTISDLGGPDKYFGYSESPIVDKDKVYCFPGGQSNNNVALDRFTGEIVWSNKALQDTFSYCSPVIAKFPEKEFIVTHSRHHLYAYDPENGDVKGSYFIEHYQYDGEHCNSPLFSNGSIYFIGNEKEDGASRIDINSEGELNVVWKNPKIKNNFNGYVQVGDYLFTTVKGNWLKALNIETGLVKDSVKSATGSIIYADNKFYCYGMNGDLNLITYNDDHFEIKGEYKVNDGTGHHFAHPVINKGILYIRHGNALIAYKI